ncbi:twin-arginine translocation signal domain-containing protein [Streptomyces sp. NPDC048290]|uniref:twin-arginine translocation signal domain-containing protein n=1 Tax=Streptomyces sp. NPDC048290 TaxID=3155811 RepID=UPI00342ADE4B
MTSELSRRGVLRRTALVAAAVALGSPLLSTPAQAATDPGKLRAAVRAAQERNRRQLTGTPSTNGWEMERTADDHGHIYTRPVPGTPVPGVQVRMGDAETILVHAIRRFHYEIDELRAGDVIGWRPPTKVRKGLPESNQASGTAVQIRPGHYPSGTRGGYFPHQLTTVRAILADCDGVLAWGGDDPHPDESLFYLKTPPTDPQIPTTAEKLRTWNQTPGKGAGS